MLLGNVQILSIICSSNESATQLSTDCTAFRADFAEPACEKLTTPVFLFPVAVQLFVDEEAVTVSGKGQTPLPAFWTGHGLGASFPPPPAKSAPFRRERLKMELKFNF